MEPYKWKRLHLNVIDMDIVVARGDPEVAVARKANRGLVVFTEGELDQIADLDPVWFRLACLVKRRFDGRVLRPQEVPYE